jgi:hypothetical protein
VVWVVGHRFPFNPTPFWSSFFGYRRDFAATTRAEFSVVHVGCS